MNKKTMGAIKGLIVVNGKNHQTTLANLCVVANIVKRVKCTHPLLFVNLN
jgi:5S rRNA maturation endonuclease (ribonuclease M5)